MADARDASLAAILNSATHVVALSENSICIEIISSTTFEQQLHLILAIRKMLSASFRPPPFQRHHRQGFVIYKDDEWCSYSQGSLNVCKINLTKNLIYL